MTCTGYPRFRSQTAARYPAPEGAFVTRISHDDSGAVVIIGSGAGGGTLAHELTRRGIKVVLLEAGARQSLASFSQVPGDAFAQLTWLEPRTFSGTSTIGIDYPTLPSWTCKTVGGTTVHWTGATPRIRPWEVKSRTTYGDIKGASLIDWPVEYSELEHYYDLAEKRMIVTRRNGNPGLPASNHFKVMYNGAKRIGYKRVHTNYMAITPGLRMTAGCASSRGSVSRAARRAPSGARCTPRFRAPRRPEIWTCASSAARRESSTAKTGLVTGVVYRDAQGREQRQKARIVCVACNSVETARLLLLSESARFPKGLANSSDQVGRNYSCHTGGFVWGVFDKPIHFWRGTTLAGIVEDETRHDPSRGFAGGYHLELAALDLPSLPLAGLPSTMWGARPRVRAGALPESGRHLHQRRGHAARDEPHHPESEGQGLVRLARRQHPQR